MKLTPAEVVIEEFKGVREVARALKVYPSTVSRWKLNGGFVPQRYHKALIDLAGGRLSTHDLIYGRANEST